MSEGLKLAEYFVRQYNTAAVSAMQEMQADAAGELIDAIDDSLSVLTLRSMLPRTAAKCIETISKASATKYISCLKPKEAAAILRYTTDEVRDALLAKLPRRQAIRVSMLLRYQSSLVGAWMETASVTFCGDTRIADAKGQVIDEAYVYSQIYVVDDLNELIGAVSMVELLQQKGEEQSVSSIMNLPVEPIYASSTLRQAVESPLWKNSDVLPVIDRDRKLIGIVRFIDLWGALEEPSSTTERAVQSHFEVLGVAEIYCLRLADVMVAALSANRRVT